METFPVLYFSYSTRYPESGTRVEFNNSYQYDALPVAPDQRIFVLRMAGMAYFLNALGQIDMTQQFGRNMAVLEAFYNAHKRAMPFFFNHPVYGQLICKFNRPLEIPEGLPGGNGVLAPFEVELIEIP